MDYMQLHAICMHSIYCSDVPIDSWAIVQMFQFSYLLKFYLALHSIILLHGLIFGPLFRCPNIPYMFWPLMCDHALHAITCNYNTACIDLWSLIQMSQYSDLRNTHQVLAQPQICTFIIQHNPLLHFSWKPIFKYRAQLGVQLCT